jgi:hypothetical protein
MNKLLLLLFVCFLIGIFLYLVLKKSCECRVVEGQRRSMPQTAAGGTMDTIDTILGDESRNLQQELEELSDDFFSFYMTKCTSDLECGDSCAADGYQLLKIGTIINDQPTVVQLPDDVMDLPNFLTQDRWDPEQRHTGPCWTSTIYAYYLILQRYLGEAVGEAADQRLASIYHVLELLLLISSSSGVSEASIMNIQLFYSTMLGGDVEFCFENPCTYPTAGFNPHASSQDPMAWRSDSECRNNMMLEQTPDIDRDGHPIVRGTSQEQQGFWVVPGAACVRLPADFIEPLNPEPCCRFPLDPVAKITNLSRIFQHISDNLGPGEGTPIDVSYNKGERHSMTLLKNSVHQLVLVDSVGGTVETGSGSPDQLARILTRSEEQCMIQI